MATTGQQQRPGAAPLPITAPSEGFVPLDEAARRLGYADREWRRAARALPVRWPRGYLELAEGPEGEPIRRMGVPDPGELEPDPGDLPDPVGERLRAQHPFVIRKHRDRALVLVTARCHFYCRFCFRRSFPDGGHRDPARAELDDALAQLLTDPDLREVILSGGDPLTLSDSRLRELAAAVGDAPQVQGLRVHSRAPVHHPDRITDALVEALRAGPPVRLVTHFNHPCEVRPASRRALARLRAGGVPLLNQAVLLRGVNDDAAVLAELCQRLDGEGVLPYYLHHPDRTPGNAAFRVTLGRGLQLHDRLRSLRGDRPVPQYVIDLPDGSGKVPVASLRRLAGGRWQSPATGTVLEDIAGPARAAGVSPPSA